MRADPAVIGPDAHRGDLLLVEDDDVDARTIERLLRAGDGPATFTVRRADTLRAAVALIEERPPTVILADLTLPDALRLEAVERLIAAAPDAPLVVQTGLDDRTTPLQTLEIGAQDYLVKGAITSEGLDRCLRHAMARHQLLRELTTTESRLSRANEELDDVAAVFAHDLRAPVRSARLLADALLRTVPEAGAAASDLRLKLDAALDRVDRLIHSMLDYESYRDSTPTLEPLALDDVVTGALAAVQADLVAADGVVEIDPFPGVRVMADRELLERVIINVVSNSIRYRHPARRLRISVSVETNGSRVCLRLGDNGKGIAADERRRAFRVMERLDPDEPGGLGLGLSICRRITESLHGSIDIEAGDGPGTVMVVELGRAVPADAT